MQVVQQKTEPLPRPVRRTGESFLIGKARVRRQCPRHLFDGLSEPTAGAQLKSHYRRPFDPNKVETGMLHRVKFLANCPLNAVELSLAPHGLVCLEPDLLDAAIRLPSAGLVLDGAHLVLKTNPGPLVAVVRYKEDEPFVRWARFDGGYVPQSTDFLVFTKP